MVVAIVGSSVDISASGVVADDDLKFTVEIYVDGMFSVLGASVDIFVPEINKPTVFSDS